MVRHLPAAVSALFIDGLQAHQVLHNANVSSGCSNQQRRFVVLLCLNVCIQSLASFSRHEGQKVEVAVHHREVDERVPAVIARVYVEPFLHDQVLRNFCEAAFVSNLRRSPAFEVLDIQVEARRAAELPAGRETAEGDSL